DDAVTVGFGPLSPMWEARRALLDEAGRAWALGPRTGPVPRGFDYGFFNAAPRDQQLDFLRAGARVVLEHLNADHPRLETRLPTVRPRAFLLEKRAERAIDVAMRCDTVWIDTDRAVVALTWRGLAVVDTDDRTAVGTIVVAAETR